MLLWRRVRWLVLVQSSRIRPNPTASWLAFRQEKSVKEFRIVFWDFDGVIKESVEVKTTAFKSLFATLGDDLVCRIGMHHEAHGGMSRFEKIPLYLQWGGLEPSPERVESYCRTFEGLVKQAVIGSPWVPGVWDYLASNHARQRFVLVTATPQAEIEEILATLGIASWFEKVFGAPVRKGEAIAVMLDRWRVSKEESVMVGDSTTDWEAAKQNDIAFVLRCTPLNVELQRRHKGKRLDDFRDE
ncbi:MAG: HAD family hydrolase [Magnetococcales bacterium]|nr:HAD family hydrolase [Magnetococcales bacterium]